MASPTCLVGPGIGRHLASAWALRLALVALLPIGLPAGASALTLRFATPISGDVVPVTLTLLDAPGGDRVEITVSIPSEAGDLRGVFGNVADSGLLAGMAADDPAGGVVSRSRIEADRVWKVGGGNTMAPVKGWDWGVELGAPGAAGGPLHTARFALTGPGLSRQTLLDGVNQGWVFGVRIQDTAGAEGSSKLGLAEGAPRIRIEAPADGAQVPAGRVRVRGTVRGLPEPQVQVNGVAAQVEGPHFEAQVPVAEGSQVLAARATNALGSATAQVSVTAGLPPRLAIIAPAEGLLTRETPLEVSGSVTGSAPLEVEVNGLVARRSGDAFHASVPLLEGENVLTATARNLFGTDAARVDVTLDSTPPAVAILEPAEGSLTTQAQVQVHGSVLDASPIAALTVNGAPASRVGSSFSASLPLALGENTLTAVATDAAGNQGSDSVVTTRGEAPRIAIVAPREGAEVEASPVVVTGRVAGTPPLRVAVNGRTAEVVGASFTTSVPLEEGDHTLTARVQNAFGEASDAVAVRLRAVPPLAVAIRTPPEGATVSAPHISVTGTVSDPAAAVSVNGVAAELAGETWTATAVELTEGENRLVATATRGSDTARDSSTVVLDLPPQVVITAPREGARFRAAATDVQGYVDDPAAFVDVNGVDARVDAGGRFVAREVSLEPGPNRLDARAVDSHGGTGRDAVEVTRDDAAAGRLRLVLVLPERHPFAFDAVDLPPATVVAEDVAEFGEALRGLGLAPERFEPPLDRSVVGGAVRRALLFAFAEAGTLGAPVEIPALGFFGASKPLRAITELDSALEELSLAPGLRAELVPDDFDPNGFAYFQVLQAVIQ